MPPPPPPRIFRPQLRSRLNCSSGGLDWIGLDWIHRGCLLVSWPALHTSFVRSVSRLIHPGLHSFVPRVSDYREHRHRNGGEYRREKEGGASYACMHVSAAVYFLVHHGAVVAEAAARQYLFFTANYFFSWPCHPVLWTGTKYVGPIHGRLKAFTSAAAFAGPTFFLSLQNTN